MLDRLGFAPMETPFRVVFTERGVTLRAYGYSGEPRPALLIVPASIKRAYIWDLAPGASVVQQCVRRGLRVYLIQWEQPRAEEEGFGLAEYADRLIADCIDSIEAETGRQRVFLAGHSLGGTLAAIFSALHPQRIQGLVLIAAPLHFGPDAGAIDRLLASAPWAHLPEAVSGNIPGSFLNLIAVTACPEAFEWARWTDWLVSLADPEALLTHMRVARWALDEVPLARQLFEEVADWLYRDDRFVRGDLRVGGRRASPKAVKAPVLSVADQRCSIVPPESVVPFHQAVRSADTRLLWYDGDTGVAVQHVGMLVGRTAHRNLWPQIIDWIYAHEGFGAEPPSRLQKDLIGGSLMIQGSFTRVPESRVVRRPASRDQFGCGRYPACPAPAPFPGRIAPGSPRRARASPRTSRPICQLHRAGKAARRA
jgi:polyhydroxyalkanoate synthase subunit PhaC